MTVSALLVGASLLLASSGIPGLFYPRSRALGERIAALLSAAGGVLGLGGSLAVLAGLPAPGLSLVWSIVPRSGAVLAADPLTAAFLLPLFLLSVVAPVYGLSYWPQAEHPDDGQKLRFFFGLLTGSMAIVTMARDGVHFLVAWETMALSAYFLVTTEDRKEPVRSAGWTYLIATHTGTLVLTAMVLLLGRSTGSFSWVPWEESRLPAGTSAIVFVLALVGFGFKAGLVPLHFWLPGAHSSAPSHVSAVLSAVMLKMGVYGFLRITSLMPAIPSWWGAVTIVAGAVTALTGVALAVGQGDLKRLLAYSSIENIGIVYVGVGTALLGVAEGQPAWALLGLAGAIFHVWNHSIFKALLFLSAGSVVHASGTREMDRMGGLLPALPRTGLAFGVGAAAVSGLPPLNGFVSEWLIYVALFSIWTHGQPAFALVGLAIPVLATTGALATASFVKVFGTVFLGSPRSAPGAVPHERPGMARPVLALAAACLVLGLGAPWLAPFLERAAFAWRPALAKTGIRILEVAPLGWISVFGLFLTGSLAVGLVALRLVRSAEGFRTGPTWDCGYAAPTSRMQYTGRSLGQWLGEQLLPRRLGPSVRRQEPRGFFPVIARFSASTPDPFHARLFAPVFSSWADRLNRLRWLQQGRIGIYLLYILIVLVGLLAWSAVRQRWGG